MIALYIFGGILTYAFMIGVTVGGYQVVYPDMTEGDHYSLACFWPVTLPVILGKWLVSSKDKEENNEKA